MTVDDLKGQLEEAFDLRIERLSRATGGDIADSYLVKTKSQQFFAKFMGDSRGLDMLKAEAEGLKAIKKSQALKVPNVIGCASVDSGGCLLLEYIPTGPGTEGSCEALGRGVAQMHQQTAEQFGWHRSNYIGSLPQENTPHISWADFYTHCRLMPQYTLALNKGLLAPEEVPDARLMTSQISRLMPKVKPALLHGDLWSGNYLISTDGSPYLIDPSVHFGHGEVDLAMSLLFGGFPSHFYDAYFEVTPKLDGFEARVALYQLYYLLVHLNLFGRAYYSRVLEIGSRFFRA